MIKTLLLAGLLSVPGLRFGMNDAQVDAWAVGQGYSKKEVNDHSVSYLSGQFAGEDFLVSKFSRCKTAGVHSFSFYYDVKQTNFKRVYQDFVDLYTTKYGEPTKQFNYYKSPYYEGDGYELNAVVSGKAYIISFWSQGDQSITIAVRASRTVEINYQSERLFNICEKEYNAQRMKGI